MGFSQSRHEGFQYMAPINAIIKNTDLTPSEIQLLSRKLSGDRTVEKDHSPMIQRSHIIISFMACYIEYMEIPAATNTQVLSGKYEKYKKAVTEQMHKDGLNQDLSLDRPLWEAYVALDFAATRRLQRIYKTFDDSKVFEMVKEAFRTGVMPQILQLLRFPVKHGKSSIYFFQTSFFASRRPRF